MSRFWEDKSLVEMNRAEWEALCDGCGKCCLHKLEDTDTGVLHYTNIACRLLDRERCSCSDYVQRHREVPDCVVLTPDNLAEIDWLPESCAYRRLADGRPLPSWHPLLAGDGRAMHRGGHSVRGWSVSELDAGDPWGHLVDPAVIHGDGE